MLTKHPLFWKEWKNAKWWSILMVGVFVIMFLSINHELQYIQMLENDLLTGEVVYHKSINIFEENFSNALFGASLVFLPITVVITALLFQSDRKESIGAFISSLPFTKKEQFKVKWLVGVMTITIPFAITSILTLLIRAANWRWIKAFYGTSAIDKQFIQHDTLIAVMLGLLQVYLFFITFYSFLMLVQTLIGNNIAASMIGVIVLAVPWFVINTGRSTISYMLNMPIRLYQSSLSEWSLFYKLMAVPRRYIEIRNKNQYPYHVGVFEYDYFWLKLAVLIIITGLSIYAGIQSYARNENSRNGQLTMFDWVEKLLLIGFTVCMALLGNTVLRSLLTKNTNAIYEITTLVISGFVGFLIIKKIISLSGGAGHD